MAYATASQISDITNVSLGNLAQILFSKGFTSQMNRTFREYESVLMKMKTGAATTERSYQFLLLTALGVNAVQWQQQGVTNVAFPAGDLSTTTEVTATMKKIQATIEMDLNMWERVRAAQNKYVDNPLALEIQSKIDVVKREHARALFGDGSSVIGKVGSASAASNLLLVVLDSGDTTVGGGNVNWFDPGAIVCFCDTSGTPVVPTNWNTAVQFQVVKVDRKNKVVTFRGQTAAGVTVNASDAVGITSSAALIYPKNILQATTLLGPVVSGTPEYSTLTPIMAGLESLSANDNRLVFGVNYTGQLGGSQYDNGGGIFDVNSIDLSMNECEQNVGVGKYSYDNILMPYNAYSALIEGKEADRRFVSVTDNTRGSQKFIYQYGNQSLECIKSYYCPFNRIYMLPKPAQGEMGESGYALELRGIEFRDVSMGGQKEFLKLNSSGQYVNVQQSFLEGWSVLIAKQPAAINCIHNFTMV